MVKEYTYFLVRLHSKGHRQMTFVRIVSHLLAQ
jgi:hypothetical protein